MLGHLSQGSSGCRTVIQKRCVPFAESPFLTNGLFFWEKPGREVRKMISAIQRFFVEEEGVSAVEYAVLLAFIAVALVASIGPLRTAVINRFDSATAALNTP